MTPLFDIDLEQCSTFFFNLPWVAWKKASAGEKEESKYQTLWLSMGLSILGGQWKWWSLQIPWAYGSIFDWVGFWSQIRIWETWLQNNWLREVFLFSCGKKTYGVVTKLKRSQGGHFFLSVLVLEGWTFTVLRLHQGHGVCTEFSSMFAHGKWWQTSVDPNSMHGGSFSWGLMWTIWVFGMKRPPTVILPGSQRNHSIFSWQFPKWISSVRNIFFD